MLWFIAFVEVVVLIQSVLIWLFLPRLGRVDHDHKSVTTTNAYCMNLIFYSMSFLLTPIAPFLARQKIHLYETTLKRAFSNAHNQPPSIFHQDPSPDADAAWDYIHRYGRHFLITADGVRGLGKDPDQVIRALEEWGKQGAFSFR